CLSGTDGSRSQKSARALSRIRFAALLSSGTRPFIAPAQWPRKLLPHAFAMKEPNWTRMWDLPWAATDAVRPNGQVPRPAERVHCHRRLGCVPAVRVPRVVRYPCLRPTGPEHG